MARGSRTWLHVGAASLGVGAALGLGLLGPQIASAAADDDAPSTSAAASAPAASKSAASKNTAGKVRPSAGATRTTAGTTRHADDDKTKRSSSARPSSKPASPTPTTSTPTSTPTPSDGPHPGDAETPQPASATVTAPPTAPQTVADEAEPPTPAATPVLPTNPWGMQTTNGSHPSPVDAPITAATASLQQLITALPLPRELRDALTGTLWTARRTFFNLAPTVAPVRVTGSPDGPIEGAVAAVDPEGDRIVYRLTQGPRFGTVAMAADGSYVYTPGADFDGVDTFAISAVDVGAHVNLLDPFRGGVATSMLVNQGAVRFEFTYTRGADEWTPQRRGVLEEAGRRLAAFILVDAPRTLTYEVDSEGADPAHLASAVSPFVSTATGPGLWPSVVQHELLTGEDLNGPDFDGRINWNWYPSRSTWSIQQDQPAGTVDALSTAMHELMHTFGFTSVIGAPGQNAARRYWSPFAQFVGASDGERAITPDFRWNTDRDFDAIAGGEDGGLFFFGPHAVAAYGAPVPIFSSSPFISASHFADGFFVGANANLMNTYQRVGDGVRTLSVLDVAVLADLGYTVVGAYDSTV